MTFVNNCAKIQNGVVITSTEVISRQQS